MEYYVLLKYCEVLRMWMEQPFKNLSRAMLGILQGRCDTWKAFVT